MGVRAEPVHSPRLCRGHPQQSRSTFNASSQPLLSAQMDQSSGEVPGRVDAAALLDSRQVVVTEDAGHDFAAAAYAGLVED